MDWLLGIFLISLGIIVAVGIMGLFFERWSAHYSQPQGSREHGAPTTDISGFFLDEKKTAFMDQSCARHSNRLGQATCHDCHRIYCNDCLVEARNPNVDNRKEVRCSKCHQNWLAMLQIYQTLESGPKARRLGTSIHVVSGTTEARENTPTVLGRADQIRRTASTRDDRGRQRWDDPESQWISEAPTRLIDGPSSRNRR